MVEEVEVGEKWGKRGYYGNDEEKRGWGWRDVAGMGETERIKDDGQRFKEIERRWLSEV